MRRDRSDQGFLPTLLPDQAGQEHGGIQGTLQGHVPAGQTGHAGQQGHGQQGYTGQQGYGEQPGLADLGLQPAPGESVAAAPSDTLWTTGQAFDTLETPPPQLARAGQRRATTQHGSTNARAYADGVVTTISGEAVAPNSEQAAFAVRLPYRSSEVIGRIGTYDLLAELGRGAMGVVYRAYSLRLCRPCALKLMIAGQHASEFEIVRFQNEAMLAARMQHPHIVSVFDAGEENGWFYFVMELVDGRPLTDLIAQNTDEALRIGLRAIAETARALHYAHEKGVVHRDIKPDNILIDAEGHPHITDFGIAKAAEAGVNMTARGALMGTPLYMSPEQANGEIGAIGPRSDVYALGVTLYHLCTGRPPFLADNVPELLGKIITDEAPSPREVARKERNRDLPLDLETICLKTVEKAASMRYPTAQALAEDIEAYLEDRPISARPTSATERLQKLIRRNRAVFVGATIVFATLMVVGAAFGAVMVSTLQRTSETLRARDERAAIDQAGTLERSIRVNMLQGRADVVRELVQALREDPSLSAVDVVRTDRTFAYTDLSTRKQVEQRLSDKQVLERIEKTFPELMPKIADVQNTAFANIDAKRTLSVGLFEYDRAGWNEIVEQVKTVVRTEREGDEPMLTVLMPMENGEKCQACHGFEDEPGYGSNKVRAVLVVKRSQKEVERKIAENRRDMIVIGAGTAGVLLALLAVFARLFGIRLRRRRFGT